ncbi:MAG: hypothetical protein K0R61_3971 [Microvirga sp.]|nr:hypothetical protein [Microvirga sp.]
MSPDTAQATKRPRDENFPVASLVLSPEHRDAVLAAIPQAARLHAADRQHKAGIVQARDLLRAFRQDVVKARYNEWAELIEYCRLSANPVGRFLLGIHKERSAAQAPADALCTALQILNHLQDCGKDHRDLGRIYIPLRWMMGAGSEKAFFDPSQAALRRSVIDSMLDRVDALIDQAQSLPEHLQNRRLRAQSIATIALARSLSDRLRRTDPVLERVQVSKADACMAFLRGLSGTLRPPSNSDHRITAAMVRRSGSSFRLGMQSLQSERRRAMHAVYAFCRAVDDIADGAAPPSEKRVFLSEWRREIDRLHRAPETPIGRELARASSLFKLPAEEYHMLLDGMDMDSAERLRIASDYELSLYGRRVAGSVGALSIRIFGAPSAHDFALNLGRTLQLVNILRDVDEDAACERVYVPLSRLAQLGLQDAILMMENYRRVLARLQARGWGTRQGRLRLSTADRLHLITRAMRPA